MRDYEIFHRLRNGETVDTRSAGNSMYPVYADREAIRIFPFSPKHPEPVLGDVVHFWSQYGFNRHLVADIFTASDGVVWLRLTLGDGTHDQFIPASYAVGYVHSHRALGINTLTPAAGCGTISK